MESAASNQGTMMKKLIVLCVAGLSLVAVSANALASHLNTKRPVVHNNLHQLYKGKENKFRYGDHDNYNPHHRKCGYMPSGSC